MLIKWLLLRAVDTLSWGVVSRAACEPPPISSYVFLILKRSRNCLDRRFADYRLYIKVFFVCFSQCLLRTCFVGLAI